MNRHAMTATLVAGIAAASLAFAACKQGDGGRCQVQSDCESGEICSVNKQVCTNVNSAGVDAAPGKDAAPDAPPDAP